MGKLPTQTYFDIYKNTDFEQLRSKLKLKSIKTAKHFRKKYPQAEKLLREKGLELGKIREHSAKIISVGALTGSLLIAPPSGVKILPQPKEALREIKPYGDTSSIISTQKLLTTNLQNILPDNPRPLTREEEKYIEKLLTNISGIPAKATLESEHLNTTYGYIGAEQHLRRYPGDSIDQHSESTQILRSGMAPGLGAWGYFAPSKNLLTPQLVETEKWYAVVQTLYLPDWEERLPYLREWYKHRKVLIVNTKNGNAVVAAIADSGPAAWTGKHFGGSPEVMNYLGGSKYKKGAVILFFVDDPENKIPLGPVDYSKIEIPDLSINT